MKKRNQNFALGLATILFVALFVATIVFLYPMLEGGGRALTVLFRADTGMAPLKEGSVVLLGGSIEVGAVTGVRIEEHADPNVAGDRETLFVVDIELRPDLPLYGDCVITTGQPTIGGTGYVLITDTGTPGKPLEEPVLGRPPETLAAAISELSRRMLAEGGLMDQISQTLDPERPGSLMFKVHRSVDDVNEMTAELAAQLNPEEQRALLARVHQIMDDINTATASLRSELEPGRDTNALARVHTALGHLERALADAAGMLHEDRPLVRSTLENIEQAARTVNQDMIAQLHAELDPENSGGMLGKLHLAMDRVNASLAELQRITSTGERLLALSRPTIEQTIGNFADMSDQLRLASQEVLLNPSKLIWGPRPMREEQLIVFQAARQFAEAASQLDGASARLEAMLAMLPTDGPVPPETRDEIERVQAAVQAAFSRFEQAEQTLWNQLK